MAKELGRDHRTLKKIVISPAQCNRRSDKKKFGSEHLLRIERQIKKEVWRTLCILVKKCLKALAMVFLDVPKSTRCRVLRTIGKCGKPEVRPLLKYIHKKKRMDWAKNNMKVNFQSVLFTDECRATLDRPGGWRRGWYCKEGPRPERIRRQQGVGGVMFWAEIIGNELFGPFRVSDGVKITAKVYMDFLKKHRTRLHGTKRRS